MLRGSFGWSSPTDPASPVSLAGIAATANPEKPRKPGLYLLWRSHMTRRRARQLARGGTMRPLAWARCETEASAKFWWTAPLPPEGVLLLCGLRGMGCSVTPYHSRRTLRLTNPQADEP